MKLLEFFDRIYVINLPERHDRRQQMTQELAKAGMPLQPGKVELFAAVKMDHAGIFPSIGLRGCYMSHLAIYRQAKQLGLRNVLVLEDDLAVSDDFKRYETDLIAQLQRSNWDAILFGHLPGVGAPPEVRVRPGDPDFATLRSVEQPFVGAHFYGVNASAFDRLIATFESVLSLPDDYSEHITVYPDGALFDMSTEENFSLLKAVPSFGGQRSSRSDCADLKWFDQLPATRRLAEIVRNSGAIDKAKALLRS